MLKSSHYVAINYVREKVKSICKISYTLFKEAFGYDTFNDISPFPTLIQLKDFICGIHHFVTVFGKYILKVIFPFYLLSIKTIWTTFTLMVMGGKE